MCSRYRDSLSFNLVLHLLLDPNVKHAVAGSSVRLHFIPLDRYIKYAVLDYVSPDVGKQNVADIVTSSVKYLKNSRGIGQAGRRS